MEQDEVAVATFNSETEALMMADILRDEGIPSVLVPLGPGAGWAATVWRPFEMRVRASDAERAREIIEAMQG